MKILNIYGYFNLSMRGLGSTLFFLSLIFNSCRDYSLGPIDTDDFKPQPVSNVLVDRLPGGVKLTYNLPKEKNLLYIKAVVNISGTIRESMASFYENSLEINGFGDTSVYDVKVYAVSRSGKYSDPISVKVKPLQPPVLGSYESLQLVAGFGGATVIFKNPTEGDLNIIMLTIDEEGKWKEADIFYTKKPMGDFSVRGYPPIERKFGVYVKDRWGNRSDTLVKVVTPYFEELLDRTKFGEYKLPTDEVSAWGWIMPNLWNGMVASSAGFHTGPGRWPQHFTFSLGVKAKMSRFKFWQRNQVVYPYSDRNIQKFELWGSNDPPADGSFNGWTLLLKGESIKPSGLPMGENSVEDMAQIVAGEEFIFPPGTPAVKYIRMKVLKTWANSDHFFIIELALWGEKEK